MIIVFCILCAFLGLHDLAAISLAILLLADVIMFKDFEIKVKIKDEKISKH